MSNCATTAKPCESNPIKTSPVKSNPDCQTTTGCAIPGLYLSCRDCRILPHLGMTHKLCGAKSAPLCLVESIQTSTHSRRAYRALTAIPKRNGSNHSIPHHYPSCLPHLSKSRHTWAHPAETSHACHALSDRVA